MIETAIEFSLKVSWWIFFEFRLNFSKRSEGNYFSVKDKQLFSVRYSLKKHSKEELDEEWKNFISKAFLRGCSKSYRYALMNMGEFPFTYEDLKLSYPALLDKFYEAISQHCYGLSKEYEHNLLNIPEFLLAMLYSVVSDVPNYPYDFYEVRDCVKSNLKGIDQRYIDVHCDGWMDSAWNSLKAEMHWQKLYVKDLPELITNPFTFDEVMSLEKFELRSRYSKRGPYTMSRELLQCQLSACIMKMACEVIPSQNWSGFNFGDLISELEDLLEKDGFLRKHFGELFVESFLNSASILLKSSTESWRKDFKGLKIRAPRNLSLSMLRTVIYECEKKEDLN